MEQLNNLVWLVYFIDVVLEWNALDIGEYLFITVVVAAMSGVYHAMILESSNEDFKLWFKNVFLKYYPYKTLIVLGLLGSVWNAIIPDKDTAYKMLAVYAGVEVIKTPEIQQIGGKGVQVLNKVMDDFLAEEEKDNE